MRTLRERPLAHKLGQLGELSRDDATTRVLDFEARPILADDGSPLEIERYPASRALRGEQVLEADMGYRFGDGTVGTLQVSYGPVRRDDGEISAGVVVFQDVTEKRAQAAHAQRRAEFEKQLIGIVSHDLRSPIGALSLGAGLLAKDPSLTPRQARLANRLVSASGRASRMITDLLDFTAARLGGGLPMKLGPCELHELTRRAIAEVLLANADERQIELVQTGDANGTWDADRVAQILVNLLTNAMHYSPPETAVMVETKGCGDRVILAVRNHGPPIPAELVPRLFLPMQRGRDQVQPSRKSVGLGLFIVDEIVRAHCGRIEVHSTEEDGTSFTVELPRQLGS